MGQWGGNQRESRGGGEIAHLRRQYLPSIVTRDCDRSWIAGQSEDSAIERWQATNQLGLVEFAPYAAFVLSVELFLAVAIESSLISAERLSNRQDIAYLYYLPFTLSWNSGTGIAGPTSTRY
jgi:hypothetical protein